MRANIVRKRIPTRNTHQAPQTRSTRNVLRQTPLSVVTALERRQFLLSATKTGNPQDLYNVTVRSLLDRGGRSLLYANKVGLGIMADFVEVPWEPWRFALAGFWQYVRQRFWQGDPVAECLVRNYVEQLGIKLDENVIEGKIRVSGSAEIHFHVLGGLSNVLQKLYSPANSNFEEHAPRERSVALPTRRDYYWYNPINRWNCIQQLGGANTSKDENKLYESLYSLTRHDILLHGARTMFMLYNESIYLAVAVENPMHYWKAWRFSKTPAMWWPSLASAFRQGDAIADTVVRIYIEDLVKRYEVDDVTQLADKIVAADEEHLELLGSLPYVISRVKNAQTQNYAVPISDSMLNITKPAEYWWNGQNRRMFFDRMMVTRGATYETMYSVTLNDFIKNFARRSLLPYAESITQAITTEFPEHAWIMWRFTSRLPEKWWEQLSSAFKADDIVASTAVRLYIEDLAQEWSIQSLHDWYRIPARRIGTTHLDRLRSLGGLSRVLVKLYPYHPWNLARFTSAGKKASQKQAFRSVAGMVPDESRTTVFDLFG